MARRLRHPSECPEAVWGYHGPETRSGHCPWCRRKIEAKVRRPAPDTWRPAETIVDAYRRMWDPDWGSAQTDEDPYYPREWA
jgi:hypothetical protein